MNKFIIKFLCVNIALFSFMTVCFADETVVISAEEEQKQKDNSVAVAKSDFEFSNKQIIVEADEYLNKALFALEENDSEEAMLNYHLFLDKINSVDIDQSVTKFLLTDCQNLIRKIKNINEMDSNKEHLNRDNTFNVSLEYDQEVLDKWIKIYTTGNTRKNIKEALERSGKYKKLIQEIFEEYNLPQELVYLPIVESLFKNTAVSRVKAVGLWQIMAHRGQALGLHINYWIDERRDPEKSTRAAAKYLKDLFILLNDWHLALSAYNRGEYGLLRDMKFSNASSISEMKERNATPKETQNFVPQFIVAVKIANNPEEYGFTDLNYEQPVQCDTVVINKVMDLKIVAKCANTTVEEIRELNPAILAWCTPHGYNNFELKLPYGSKDEFLKNIANEKDLNPSPGYIKHKVKRGEWLEKLAQKYKTTPKAIKKDNPQLSKQKYLKVGQVLIIRPGKKYYNGK